MSPEMFALAVAIAVFASGVIGLLLQRILHESFTTGGPRDMIGAVVGLLTLLSALTIGLLIWTAYGVYAGQNAAIQTLAAKFLQLDLALAEYGTEAKDLRLQVRDGLGKTIDAFWGAKGAADFAADNFAEAMHNMGARDQALDALQPSTAAQTQALAVARATSEAIGQSRLQMSFALASPVSYPLILIVVAWAVLLFCGFGLMSSGHAMSLVAVFVGACAAASAVYMILDLSSPYSGTFRASPTPLKQVLAVPPGGGLSPDGMGANPSDSPQSKKPKDSFKKANQTDRRQHPEVRLLESSDRRRCEQPPIPGSMEAWCGWNDGERA
jgi:hypothetical protein